MEGQHMPNGFQQVAERISSWLSRATRPTAVSELFEIPVSIGATIGEVRKENQDRAVVARYAGHGRSSPFVLLGVCDGIGGMVEGAICAELALATIIQSLVRSPEGRPTDVLASAVLAANEHIYGRYRERGGTTVVALLFMAGITGVSVGDSRIYVHNPPSGLKQISIDDSIAGELSRLNIEAGDTSELSSSITQFVGMGQGIQPRTYDIEPIPMPTGHYLLTTDGAHGVAFETLQDVVASAPSDHAIVARLIQISRWCGGKDNATVISASPGVLSSKPTGAARSGLLEIWDSARKFEIFVEAMPRVTVSAGAPLEIEKLTVAEPPKRAFPRRQRSAAQTKSSAPTKKRSQRKEEQRPPERAPAAVQRPLNISIVDSEASSEGSPSPEQQSAPEKPPHATEG